MALDVNRFVPNEENLTTIWKKMQAVIPSLETSFPRHPIGFVCWLTPTNAEAFVVGPPDDPVGLFVFTGIVDGDSAFSHVFFWDLSTSTMHERVQVARDACAATMMVHNLRRLQGLTPVSNMPARLFGERVGYKYLEGRLRQALHINGGWEDAWVCDALAEDFAARQGFKNEIIEENPPKE